MKLQLSRASLIAKKYAPEILIGFGITGMVGTAVGIHRAAYKFQNIKEIYEDVNETIELYYDDERIEYSEENYNYDKRLAKVNYILNAGKLYAPIIGLGVLSLVSIAASHEILSRRNMALIAAYKLLDEGFKKYRSRVVDSIDEAADRYFRFGGEERKYQLVEGKKKKKDVVAEPEADNGVPPWEEESIYARYFDESSLQFKRNNEMNLHFLQSQQTYANQLLQTQGHVFLNEIYDCLGIPRSRAGSVVGWVKDHGDNYISFDLENPDNGLHRDFVNGYSEYVRLDFNVDGVIWDII